MYIIETGLKTGSFVNIMEIENKHIEDLIYSYLMGDISEEGRNELLQWLETDDAHKQRLSEMADCWATAHVPLFASDMKADFQKHFGTLIDPAIPSERSLAKFSVSRKSCRLGLDRGIGGDCLLLYRYET